MSDSNYTNGLATSDLAHNDHRAAVNRANAQHSTGPRTEAGKQRSSLNALRHGLTGHVIVLPTEDHAAYDTHSKRFFDDLQPQGALEQQLVQSLAETSWRLNRVAALETNLLTLGMIDQSAAINTAEPEVHAALATAASLREQSRALSNLSMHEQRLSRQFERALHQLREIQSERREKEEKQLQKAAELLQLDQDAGLSYKATEDGFVFSNDEIETFIRRRDRRHEASTADAQRRYT
jgi:hypothetical protein